VKTVLQGRRFEDIEDVKRNVTAELHSVSLKAFYDCFVQLLGRYKQCVAVKEDNFEEK
jgi:hypothetical protein